MHPLLNAQQWANWQQSRANTAAPATATATATPESEYVAQQGALCPFCGDTARVDAGEPEFEVYVGGASSPQQCAACGGQWRDHYKLSGYDVTSAPTRLI